VDVAIIVAADVCLSRIFKLAFVIAILHVALADALGVLVHVLGVVADVRKNVQDVLMNVLEGAGVEIVKAHVIPHVD
jgi:hypothetical protein